MKVTKYIAVSLLTAGLVTGCATLEGLAQAVLELESEGNYQDQGNIGTGPYSGNYDDFLKKLGFNPGDVRTFGGGIPLDGGIRWNEIIYLKDGRRCEVIYNHPQAADIKVYSRKCFVE